jgi:hypothetical protein
VKRVLAIALLVFVACLAGQACDYQATCPEDGEQATFTGATHETNGKTYGQYKHYHPVDGGSQLHVFWASCNY